MVLVIDNFDSFTYNLVQLLGRESSDIRVMRNNDLTIDDIVLMQPEGILISPGPGRPEDAGISIDVVRRFGGRVPVFGVCLGHQAIGAAFGGNIVQAPSLMHGKTSAIQHKGEGVFEGVPNPFVATRYHSLVIEPKTLPDDLVVTAWAEDGAIMGIRHRTFPIEGVQFHPESILTQEGHAILRNWLYKQKLL